MKEGLELSPVLRKTYVILQCMKCLSLMAAGSYVISRYNDTWSGNFLVGVGFAMLPSYSDHPEEGDVLNLTVTTALLFTGLQHIDAMAVFSGFNAGRNLPQMKLAKSLTIQPWQNPENMMIAD